MKQTEYKTVVVGSGISGLYSVLKIKSRLKSSKGVLLVTKSELSESNSYYAQGGMVAVLEENKKDSVELHVNDTLKAGAGLSEVDAVNFISRNSDKVVKDLLNFGVDFDRDEDGKFALTKEGAHSINRILHCGGDATGREMEIALSKSFKASGIDLYENTIVTDIVVNSQKECCGLVVYHTGTCEYEYVKSSSVIFATGGLGQLYKYTTNPSVSTGDGFALCYRVGAEMQDMEFVQFHPTALAYDDENSNNRFLISEAVRGEGAKLKDCNGREFMADYDERLELAPRDIVARAIFNEMEKSAKPNVYLDASVIEKTKLLKRFPTIFNKCSQIGIDITKDYIPVAPSAHYFMGGVKTNLECETSVKRLYAIGECASTGLHGGNRLASNSLLECVVCAYTVAQKVSLDSSGFEDDDASRTIIKKYETGCANKYPDTERLKKELKDIMWENVGIYRNESGLKYAYDRIRKMQSDFDRNDVCYDASEYELRNMLQTSELITKSALARQESRGAHYRTDFLDTDSVAKHSVINNDKGENHLVK